MPERLIAIVTPIKDKWIALTRRQQIQLAGGIALLLLALILFLFFTFRTTWTVLYRGETWMRLSLVQSELHDAGIRTRLSADSSTLYVPTRNRQDASTVIMNTDLAIVGQMPLADALDLTGLGTTEAERTAILNSAHSTDIELMLQRHNDIVDAQVIFNPMERNLLLRPNQPSATMSVTIVARRQFSPAEGQRLAELLRNAVSGLELENITILDQHGNAVFNRAMIGDDGGVNDVNQQRRQEEQRVMSDLRTALELAFDTVQTAHHFSYYDRIDDTVTITIYNAPDGTEMGLPISIHTSQQEMEGMMGINFSPGLGSNMQAMPTYQMGDPTVSSASARESAQTLRHNSQHQVINRGPGGMVRDESMLFVTVRNNIDVCEATFFERNPEATIEDWWARTDALPYRNRYIIHEGEEVNLIRQTAAMSTGVPIANIGAIIIEYFNVIPAEDSELPIATIIMLIVMALLIAMLLIALLARRKEEEEEIEPELSVEDLLATTQLEEAKEEEARLKEIEYDTDNEIKKQIDKFVNEKPEAVAALLRNWLNAEEW